MPEPLIDAFAALQAGLAELPAVAIVIALMVGPTLAWMGYRMYVMPRKASPKGEASGLFWICRDCRSANKVRDHFCYHCGLDRTAEDGPLRVVDHDAIVELAPDESSRPPVPVGPGRPEPVVAAAPLITADVATVATLAATLERTSSAAAPGPVESWTCDRCLMPNALEDDRCGLCDGERMVATSGRRATHLAVVPDLPTKPTTKRTTKTAAKPGPASTRASKSVSSRRDAAS